MPRGTGKSTSILPFVPQSRRQLIWLLCKRQIGWIFLAMVIALGQAGIVPLTAGALRDFVDLGIVEKTQPIGPLAARLMVLAFVSALTLLLLNQVISRVIFHLEFELRVWLHERLQALDPRALDSVATGQLVTRAMTDIVFMESFILLMPYITGYTLVLLAIAAFLMTQNVMLTVVAFMAIPLNLWPIFRMRKPLWGFSWVSLQRRAEVTTVIDETVRGARVVKAFNRGPEERRKLAKTAEGAFSVAMNRGRFFAKYEFILRLIPALLQAAILFFAARMIVGGTITLGIFLVFFRYSSAFNQFANSMADFVNVWQHAKAATGRIIDLISFVHGGKAYEHRGDQPVPEPSSGLHMSQVHFDYGTNNVLKNLDLDVAPGQLVVVTGGPRSGKSTVTGLAVGALEPVHGTIQLDGVDVAAIDDAELRRQVRVLTEEPFLFGRSVRENLEMGAGLANVEGLPDDVLHGALYAAGADEVVAELPDGLDEVLGDRGLTLSGGQRQRLALARALVAPPRVLILDDALLAVNPNFEVDIIRRVRAHAPRSAILYLSRRDGPAALADAVVHLPDARDVTGGDIPEPDVAAGRDMPVDTSLLDAMANLPPDRDVPPVGDEQCETSDEEPSLRSMLKPLVRPFVGVLLLVLAATFLNLVPEGLLQPAVDAIEDGRYGPAQLIAFIGFLAAASAAAVNWRVRIRRTRVQEGAMYMLRRRMLHRLTRLGVDFYDRELPGQVAARAVYDLDRVSDLLSDQGDLSQGPLYAFMTSIFVLTLTVAAMFFFSIPIALIALLFVPFLIVASAGFLPVADRAYDRQRAELGRTIARLQEDFAGRHVIHGYVGEDRSQAEFIAMARQLRRAQRWAQFIQNSYDALIWFTIDIAGAAVLWRAGTLVLGGAISVGVLVTMREYIDRALSPIPRATRAFRYYLVAKASLHTLRQPFRAPINPPERDDAVQAPRLAGEIVFNSVDFTYPGTAREVLRDVSFTIAPGEIVAMVGPTGAGKSSIAKLVGRTYDPNDGAVLADGVDLCTYDVGSYRSRLGIVPQDAFCFRGTVASNIAYGRPSASREEIEDAARVVGAHATLMSVPGGFDGVVEEEGRNLTAAQRQMMALARAWLAGPDLLILDEATSTLSLELEQKVLDAIGPLQCTTIFITHRLGVALRADKVIVIDEGRVVEQGTHDELITAGGAYSALWSIGTEVEGARTITQRTGAEGAEPTVPAPGA